VLFFFYNKHVFGYFVNNYRRTAPLIETYVTCELCTKIEREKKYDYGVRRVVEGENMTQRVTTKYPLHSLSSQPARIIVLTFFIYLFIRYYLFSVFFFFHTSLTPVTPRRRRAAVVARDDDDSRHIISVTNKLYTSTWANIF